MYIFKTNLNRAWLLICATKFSIFTYKIIYKRRVNVLKFAVVRTGWHENVTRESLENCTKRLY